MKTKLQELLDELKGLYTYEVPFGYQDREKVVRVSAINELIAKYTETTSDNESNTCDNCLFCYHCKNDDGRWVVCNNDKNKEYVKSIDRTFGCILFEPIN